MLATTEYMFNYYYIRILFVFVAYTDGQRFDILYNVYDIMCEFSFIFYIRNQLNRVTSV